MNSDTWIEQDEKSIGDDILVIAKEETGLTSFKSVGVLRGFIETVKRIVIFIYNTAINLIYKNATLDGATGFFLTCWGLNLGVVRKQSAKTSGYFTGTAYGSGKISAGTWAVIDGTDLRYKVTQDISFAEGAFNIPVIAEFSGIRYNVGAGVPVRITRVISGLESALIGADWITALGQETEEDEPYRERIKTRWRDQTLGDTKDTYKYFAEQVDGVRSAKIIRTPRGPGSTDVIIASINGAPEDALLEAVRTNLHNHELMAFDVQVKPPEIMPLDIEIEYSGDASQAEMRLVAEQYVYSLDIGGRFQISRLYELYRPFNLNTVEILSPDRDVQAETLYLIVGNITITKAAA
ncbi:MAG: baseplate J/gp47 family protein [Treponema sp.]|jgi:hypothetical protein|nr:baseplate J/gp47 family protein [Treponema sp.]